MRTIIDLPQNQIKILKKISKDNSISRAEIIRRALSDYLKKVYTDKSDNAFGVLADIGIDSVEYQRKLRKEWDRKI